MAKSKAGNNQFLKKYNQTVILDLIRIKKAVSRAELSQATGLSPTAIGAIVANLTEKGYIHETGTGESRGGRRPVMVELKPESYFSVGIELETDYVRLVIVDITGRTICETGNENVKAADCENVVLQIDRLLKKILDRFSINEERLLGIGISVPGMVDGDTHEVVFAPNLGWRNVNIGEKLGKLAGVPVYVENEAMSSAICENWIGSCQDTGNFVCVNISSGIGAGIFTHGRLYRGAGGSAGEVGHILVDENGPKCGCGNYGCLETLASTSRITEKARKMVRQGIVSTLNDLKDSDNIGIDNVVEAARAGDDAARGILAESARYLGIGLSNIINTLNPAKIVLGKEFTKYADLVMDGISSIVACKSLRSAAEGVEITASGFGEKSSVLGAAIIPLKILFCK